MTVVYARESSGRFPAETFLEQLRGDANRRRDHAGLFALFQLLADQGQIRNEQQFRHLAGTSPSLFEFKKRQVRIMAFYERDARLVLTHGFVKQQPRTPRREIERAQRIREEHVAGAAEDVDG